ncbi:hypothetical protein F5B22DRAFT_658111 [Xylaria bambusicola]|uniref:uncharacterized protein n=1 Tax=Xylaria bambusicola TaxID=326684 RepID=UPI002008A489|nr:uncharacterized protein F5B22DRAFT_658111 [Xylaria bambusicola]KAI0509546.1 hypothetical protein F5B22DRAFT_658111 [Xylaria bambusicola]
MCYIFSYASWVEFSGEDCYFLRQNDLQPIDRDPKGIAIFKKNRSQIARYLPNEVCPPTLLNEIEGVLKNSALDLTKLRSYLESRWNRITAKNTQQSSSLEALAFATGLYESLEGCTVNIEVVKEPLYKYVWAQKVANPRRSQHVKQPLLRAVGSRGMLPKLTAPYNPILGDTMDEGSTISNEAATPVSENEVPNVASNSRPLLPTEYDPSQLAESFACITTFETGEFNINPESLQGIHRKSTFRHPIRRVFGNLGRPEIAFLIPPSSPKLKDYDLKSWHLINHTPFNGTLEDNFSSTSLHLSFTDFEMPVDIGVRGLRDTLVVLIESLVSVNDKGTHIGDLDIMSMLRSDYITLFRTCYYPWAVGTQTSLESLISIDSWDEFLDLPGSPSIVRAYGNWQARLAIATASVQRKKHTLVLPQESCLQCIQTGIAASKFDVIIA